METYSGQLCSCAKCGGPLPKGKGDKWITERRVIRLVTRYECSGDLLENPFEEIAFVCSDECLIPYRSIYG
jgi:hypothetical protein